MLVPGLRRRYIHRMAALAQPTPQEAAITEALASVALPKGVRLLRFALDNDWTGDPAVHVVYGVSKKIPDTKANIKKLVDLSRAVREAVDELRLDRFTYVNFEDVR
jgi:hypothetical protein